MSSRSRMLVLFCALFAAAPAAAQDVRFIGQLRPRFEGRTPNFPGPPPGDVIMRARAGIVATLPEEIGLRVELQDVIIWGGTASTPGASFAAEVHQAFVDVGGIGGDALLLRLGRQEMPIGNQRLISNNNWGHRGRRFDGARAIWEGAGVAANAFALRIADAGTDSSMNSWFHGAHAAIALQQADTIALYLLYNRERDAERTDQLTTGTYATFDVGGIRLVGEGYLQGGTRRETDARAYMFSIGVRRAFGPATLNAAYDHYSGDDDADAGTTHTFDRLFASNHRFHGYADLFTGSQLNTGGRGLRDFMLRTRFAAGERTSLELNGHAFRVAAGEGLGSTR